MDAERNIVLIVALAWWNFAVGPDAPIQNPKDAVRQIALAGLDVGSTRYVAGGDLEAVVVTITRSLFNPDARTTEQVTVSPEEIRQFIGVD